MSVPVQIPPLPSSAPAAPPRPGKPVVGFLIDFVLAAALLFFLSTVTMVCWGLYRGLIIGAEKAASGGADPDVLSIASQMGTPGPLAQILVALVSTGGAALITYFCRRNASRSERQLSFSAAGKASTWGWTLLVAALVIAGSNGIAYVADQLGVKPVPTNLDLMTRAMDQFPVFLSLFAVILAPAYEELLFRRVLFGRLWQAGRPWLGMLLSSLAFALVHEVPGTSANGPAEIAQLWLVYGGMGAAFCWLYQRTGTLWAPIAAHALNNAVALLAMVFLGLS